jgi:hypothetical protein
VKFYKGGHKLKVAQVYAIVNEMKDEIVGSEVILNEDLSNIVDIGKLVLDSTDMDNYAKKLIDKVGKVVFVDRVYAGSVPSILMDAWEFGSILQKVSVTMPEAEENESWKLENGQVYEQDKFYKPDVQSKFFNSRVTFDVPMSFTDIQVKSAWNSAVEMNAFLSMIYTAVENTMTVRLDALIMRTINSMTAQTIHAENPTLAEDVNGVKAVNLLHMYNTKFTKTLTPAQAITDMDFIKYSSYIIKLYVTRISRMSTLFNVGGQERFTPKDQLHVVMLTDFYSSASVYLQSDTFHDELVALPMTEEVSFWQGSGKDYGFDSTSKINVKIPSGATTAVVEVGGIIGTIFDTRALGVTNMNRRTTSHYNSKAEFTNNFYKMDAGYYNDLNENFVVFYLK